MYLFIAVPFLSLLNKVVFLVSIHQKKGLFLADMLCNSHLSNFANFFSF